MTKQATCKQNGIKTYTCKECRETKTETIPKTADHTWDRGKIIKDATCKEAGEKTYTCTICETKKAEVITRKTDHNWNHGNIIKAATCTKNGERVYTCLTCGERKKEVLPATGHHYGSWVNLLPATVFTSAQHRHICSKCGTSETLSYGRKIRPTIKLNASSLKLKVKQSTIKLTAGGLASGDYVRSWSTSNKKIVTVSKKANGKCRITAKKAGRAKVTVVLASGLKKTISVTVQKRDITCTSIKGVPKAITLIRKRSYQLRPQIFPITCTKKVSYISSKKKIVKVNSKGKITGGKKGSVKIIVKVGKKKFTCKVKVR
ncbi:Ig-like domain-containing protein [Anaerostipes hominis (ex Lee et al. 2021)]|uniref:Ig-like domain-containing protein n=1 Tax=Anaerostipes hominis (ex Lee et al. 2021) TaxID=2025494 RepID=UPI00130439C7|nr:Ig-like domain-containing protein [Anaerostipes hominis (ex Lee et al. 2021)]